ncbi:MAG: ubiquinone/menaquinone biosynthesis methyltransferase [Candidatus Amesbacteria bacterium GW2011_GWA2_47_11b]|uniref:Ubiquinone/menaquinone biosynthesis methyltransferase n=3 Tax=Candidatus Amesiibacteriota TaxID=1752730 RepID=A0A0G1SHK5_9BACT|nr:MAG: ubiquinone/menaquinone biosynthesis methyltransferase [Microgenomates group bacterium GW2011_GWC1_46_20]KKU58281.1 MAG: ubiquinone/menaquinone biosynthesis methyltransferase [Candidatus Amesbacteria bacterium GW2011_GWA2_47_11b]KKU68919.1 MAG: ubiquinone/menaquinone biosynthesis methyltransferase [Candidatus Amesbacteria bacterium GW2011_GWA1_47_20]KKU83588.1 MAG: ubiquinone/menaquinone biosynthesis methyltransferase [Candidatus Amesbacteria bacterium GW2011_GWC2_47_8]
MTKNSYNKFSKVWKDKVNVGIPAHIYLEKPAMTSLLPNLEKKEIICIGCGSGEECKSLKMLGAKRIVGIDASSQLINLAKNAYPDYEFYSMNMESMKFPSASFDFAYSSLTLHYVNSWSKTLKQTYRILKPGGTFLFSIHHPLKTAMSFKRDKEKATRILGYVKYRLLEKGKVYGDYLNEREIEDKIFNRLKITYFHRPMSLLLKDIFSSNFKIVDMIEPKPVSLGKKEKGFWKIHQKIPLVLIFKLQK